MLKSLAGWCLWSGAKRKPNQKLVGAFFGKFWMNTLPYCFEDSTYILQT
jgi:hypothetical protein